jgi:hypothetical protein
VSSAFPAGTLISKVTSGTAFTTTQNSTAALSSASLAVVGAQFHFSGTYSGTVGEDIAAIAVHSGFGVLIDGGVYQTGSSAGAPAYATDFKFDGLKAWGSSGTPGNTSGLPVLGIISWPGTAPGAGVANVHINVADVETCSAGSPLVDVNGYSAGNRGGNVNSVETNTIDLEARAVCNGLHIIDSHSINFTNVTAEAPGLQTGPIADNNMAAVAYIDESYPGSTTTVHMSGTNFSWPTTLIDWVDSASLVKLQSSVTAGCSSITVTSGQILPLAGQPVKVMDGLNSEVLYAAYGTPSSGTTINIASPGCTNAHATSIYVAWNPKWLGGPGPAGIYSGQLTIPAGSLVNDGTGVVTATVSNDNYVFEDRHIGEWINVYATSSDGQFELGRVQITGLGAYCTISGAQGTCANNQFQFVSPTHTAYTSTAQVTICADVYSYFDFNIAGDSVYGYSQFNPGVRVPEFKGSANFREGMNPTALTVSGLDSDNHLLYNRLFLGSGGKLEYTGAVGTDQYVEAQCATLSNAPVTCPAFHVRSGPAANTPLYLGAHGVDNYEIDPADGLLHIVNGGVEGNPVAVMPSPPVNGHLAAFNATSSQLVDSGVPASSIQSPVQVTVPGDLACAVANDTTINAIAITSGSCTASQCTVGLSLPTSGITPYYAGQKIMASGATPSGYNTNTPVAISAIAISGSSSTITYPNTNNPGGWTSGGNVSLGCYNTASDALSATPVTFQSQITTAANFFANTPSSHLQAMFQDWSASSSGNPAPLQKLYYGSNPLWTSPNPPALGASLSGIGGAIEWAFSALTQTTPALVLATSVDAATVPVASVSGNNWANAYGLLPKLTDNSASSVSLQLYFSATGVASAAYVSGGSPSGTGNVTLSSFNGSCSGATATMAVSSGVPGAITINTRGTGCTAAATTATCTSGTATCSGTVTLASVLGGAAGNARMLNALTWRPN